MHVYGHWYKCSSESSHSSTFLLPGRSIFTPHSLRNANVGTPLNRETSTPIIVLMLSTVGWAIYSLICPSANRASQKNYTSFWPAPCWLSHNAARGSQEQPRMIGYGITPGASTRSQRAEERTVWPWPYWYIWFWTLLWFCLVIVKFCTPLCLVIGLVHPYISPLMSQYVRSVWLVHFLFCCTACYFHL